MEETKVLFVGIAIGMLLAGSFALFMYGIEVSKFDDQISNLTMTLFNITNKTQAAYDIGFNYSALFTTYSIGRKMIDNNSINIFMNDKGDAPLESFPENNQSFRILNLNLTAYYQAQLNINGGK